MTKHVAKHVTSEGSTPKRIVLVLQGGAALGAYQGGVYQALDEAGLRPDWVIGTSIGAVNGSIIAGNAVPNRLSRLRQFWDRLSYKDAALLAAQIPVTGPQLASWVTMAAGMASFYRPNPVALFNHRWPMAPEQTGLYSTEPLRETLTDLIQFPTINGGTCRLTVGAANVRTAEMHYFDSRDTPLDLNHVMASMALPPAFPAVRIGKDLFWDGGILSNTPIEAVLDDYPRRSALVFVVNVWNALGKEPTTIEAVIERQKDLQFASRAHSHIRRQVELHHLRHVVAELAARIPEPERATDAVQALAGYGCLTQMHLVRLRFPAHGDAAQSKEIDFSPSIITKRWQAGLEHTAKVIARAPWTDPVDPIRGFVLHDAPAAHA